MSTENPKTDKTLKGDEAIKLWQQGREAWNTWVENNPLANIDFSGFDFEPYRAEDQHHESILKFNWPFSGFHFPKEGNVNFHGAKFGYGHVSFYKADFGDVGNVNFGKAKFGDVGKLSFGDANYRLDRVSFSHAHFGDRGNVCFRDAKFGDGYSVDFSHADFGDRGNVDFSHADFGDGYSVDFSHAHFGNGYSTFYSATFGYVKVDFSLTVFASRAFFQKLKGASKIKALSFQHTTLEGGIILSTNMPKDDFACVPDLRGAKYSHQITLDNIHCKPEKDKLFILRRNEDAEDAARSRRLKEISEQNKDHDSALRFKALELQAARYHSNTNLVGLILESCFHLFSNYGRSVFRPLLALGLIWYGFGYFYSQNLKIFENNEKIIDASLVFSARQMFPLITSLRDRKFSYDDLGWGMDVLMFSQSILSLIFLFLIGLALRNLFRL